MASDLSEEGGDPERCSHFARRWSLWQFSTPLLDDRQRAALARDEENQPGV
jgi:hypothetical protein